MKGLALTSANYDAACSLLIERFGKKDRIVFAHIQTLLNVTVLPGKNKTAILWKLQDELLTHIRSLESLGITGDTYGFLTPVILSRLPNDMEWSMDGEGHECDLNFLLEFLKKDNRSDENI